MSTSQKLDDNKEQDYAKTTKFMGTYSYVITKKCAKFLLKNMIIIKEQIDYQISSLSDKINIYSLLYDLCYHIHYNTNIQTPINDNGKLIKEYWHVDVNKL